MATPAAPPTDGNKPSRTWKLSLSGPLVLERVLLAAGFVVLVIVNVAAGASNRRVSDRFSTPITPAGWAFSIWGLIFFLQAVGVVYAAIPWGYGRDDLDGGAKGRHVAAVALPWFCGWAFQDLWQFSFIPGTRVGMWFALLFIVAAFCCMAWGVVRLFAAGKASGPLPARNALAALAFAAFNVPASLNAAWLSAASVVAMLVVPASRGVARDAASVVWLGVALCAAITALAVYVALVKPDVAWPATLVWALAAIAVAHGDDARIRVAALVCMGVAAAATAAAAVRVARQRKGAVPLASANAPAATTA